MARAAQPTAPRLVRAAACALAALASAGLAAAIALHHPLSPSVVLLGCMVLAALTCARPVQWPLWLLAVWPWLGWMPWTGWLIAEEFDLAVLAVAAGGYLRMSGGWPHSRPQHAVNKLPLPRQDFAWLPWLVLLPLLLSTLISMQRGFADAGGLSFGWWQGYREPLNSLRLAKPLLEVLLLLPLWRAASAADERAASQSLLQGLLLLLMGAASVVWWERLAFTGLLDFATDYRATGPFWEMHVGGAALDACLALAMPFAVAAVAASGMRGPWGAVATGVLVLALYAALVTFSRIVYAALPLGLMLWWLLAALHRPKESPGHSLSGPWLAGLWGLLWTLGFAALAWFIFPSSGYRGLLALCGAVALLLPLAQPLRGLTPAQRVLGIGMGLVLAAVVAAVVWLQSKAAYLVYAAAWAGSAGALWCTQAAPSRATTTPATPAWALLGVAGVVATLAAAVAVAWHWGGAVALTPAWIMAAVLGLVMLLSAPRRAPSWPAAWRWQAQLMAALLAVAALVGVFSGGAYMGGRMKASAQDSQDRRAHWSKALSLLSSTDWLLGKGLGRYWANQSLSGLANDQTGDYRWLPPTDTSTAGTDGAAAVLTSGRHELGSGEALRLSQRVPMPAPGPLTLRLKVRNTTAIKLQAEVCEKHLLYPAGCAGVEHPLPALAAAVAATGTWQPVEMQLKGDPLSRGAGGVPRSAVFSLSLGTHQTRAEIDALSLQDAQGHELLHNGDFEQGLARWYFSSDRYHLPWHAKNMAVHLLFEQGLLGLGAFVLLVGVALWRVALGAARGHPLAPALAAGCLGLLVVGLVDSLLDMPRIAFVSLLLLTVMLTLSAPGQSLKARAGP